MKTERNTLAELLRAAAENYGERGFHFCGKSKGQISYRKLDQCAARMAGEWAQAGLKAGDHAFLCIDDTKLLTLVFWSGVYAGIVWEVVPYDTAALAGGVQGKCLMKESAVRVLVSDNANLRERLSGTGILRLFHIRRMHSPDVEKPEDSSLPEFPFILQDKEGIDSADQTAREIENFRDTDRCNHAENVVSQSGPEDPAFALYTSGTQGKSKRIAFSHRLVLESVCRINALIGRNECTVTANILPLFHVTGFFMFFLAPLQFGAVQYQIPHKSFVSDPGILFDVLKRDKVTDLDGMNYVLHILLDYESSVSEKRSLQSVENILLAGEVMDASLMDAVTEKYGIRSLRVFYGMTECLSCAVMSDQNAPVLKLDGYQEQILRAFEETDLAVKTRASAGNTGNGTVCILDQDGKPLSEEGVPGEIGIRKACVGELERFDWSGDYYHSGDLGVIVNRNLYVIGRIDDMLIINGLHYHPGDIEKDISDSMFGGCCELAIIRDDIHGRIVLFAETGKQLREEEKDAIRKRILDDYALVIDSVETIIEFPKTASGKKSRKLFRPFLLQQESRTEMMDSIGLIRLEAELLKTEHVRIPVQELAVADTEEKRRALIRKHREKKERFQIPAATARTEELYAPFHLTEMQQAYLMGRDEIFDISNICTMLYYEFLCTADLDRLEDAFLKLINTQPALRLRIEDGKQCFLPKEETDFKIEREDLSDLEPDAQRETIDTFEKAVREEESASGARSLFRMKAFQVSEDAAVLCVAIDLIALDAGSTSRFFELAAELYRNPEKSVYENPYTFRDYVLDMDKIRETELYKEDEAYWQEKIRDFSGPANLRMQMLPSEINKPHFERLDFGLSASEVNDLQREAAACGVTLSTIIMAFYARVLAYESGKKSCGLNVTVFNRYSGGNEEDSLLGEFTSTILVDAGLDRGKGCRKSLEELQEQVYTGLAHRLYSGIRQARDYKKAHHLPGNAASMPYVFTSTLGSSSSPPAEIGRMMKGRSQTTQVYLDCQASWKHDGGILISWDFVRELYDPAYLKEMLSRMKRLILTFAQGGNIWELLMLSSKDRALLETYNNTEEEWIKRTIVESFLEKASKLPGKIAVKDEKSTYTYRELDLISNGIAEKMQMDGIVPDDFVAVLCERKKSTIALMLGILKCGAAYVPVDVKNPEKRRREIISGSGAKLFADASYLDDVKPSDKPVDLSMPEKRAYVIYTSGSTGKPKGVVITHKSAMNTIDDINRRYQVNEKDVLIGLSSMSFDLSVYDIFGALSSGAELLIIADLYDVHTIAQQVVRERVTIWNSVPAIVQMYISELERREESKDQRGHHLDYACQNQIRLFLMSGDWIPVDLPNRIEEVLPGSTKISLGGATEASIWSVCYPITKVEESWKSIPYGMPLKNQTLYVLNENMEPCPLDREGDIWIGGAGVALEYLNDPEKTSESYRTHPKYGRIYRTGDRGVMRPEGYMEFCGRMDGQVKIAGNRIELGEIENNVIRLKGVRECSAVVERSKQASPKIYAFYTGKEIPEEELTEHLNKYLVSYMIPEKVIHVERIPLTANQKVDRKQLLAMIPKQEVTLEEPETMIEQSIAKLWKKVLNLKQVGINQNFYDVDGDSLKLVRLTTEINEYFHIHLTHGQLLHAETIRQSAALVERVLSEEGGMQPEMEFRADPEHRDDPFELTEIQKAYLVGRDDIYEISGVATHGYYEYRINLDLRRLEDAINRIIAAQPMLRMVIDEEGMQRFLPPEKTIYSIPVTDARGKTEAESKYLIWQIRERTKQEMREVSDWPLFSLQAVRTSDEESCLIFSVDLLCMDAASVGLFKTFVMNAYTHPEESIKEAEFSFRDFVQNLKLLYSPQRMEQDRKFWMERIADFPPAPALRQRMSASDIEQPHFIRLSERILPGDWEALAARARTMRVSPSAVLLTLYGECLAFWSGQERTGINVTVFNKYPMHPDLDRILGDFTSTMLLAITGMKGSFEENVHRVQQELISGLEHRAYSGMAVGRDLKRQMNLRNQNVMPYVFTSTLGSQIEELDFGEEIYSVSQTSQVYLDCQIMKSGKDISVTWDCVEELFDPQMMKMVFDSFTDSIRHFMKEENPEAAFSLSEKEKQLLQSYNDTFYKLPKKTLIGAFRDTVKTYPEKAAVKDGTGSYTFRELDQISSRVAGALRSLGIKTGDFVALMGDRRRETIALLLGILKTGAAYVPVDRGHPQERINEIIRKSEAKLLIDFRWMESCTDLSEPISVLKSESGHDQKETPDSDGYPGCGSKGAAYVIFTSGSTGKPKGVLISMDAVMNTIYDINRRFHVTADDVILGLSAMNFDLSVYDVFGAMTTGATIVMAEDIYDTEGIYHLAQKEKVTIWNSVPALMQMLVIYQEEEYRAPLLEIRLIMLSGDWIPLSLPEKIRQYEPNANLYSLGGATEASIWSIYYPVTEVRPEWKSIPYGMPLANQTFFVLNGNRVECPVGVEGDLWIGGTGVAAGYLNDPDKTGEAFVRDSRFGRIYKTGDRGRMTEEGYIEFLGRKDGQVKIRGHRIELGEIEHVISEVSGCNEVVADVVELHAARHIYAFAVGLRMAQKELLAALKQKLPGYMLPTRIIQIDKIPLTANQKVNKKALHQLLEDSVKKEIVKPRKDTERILAEFWQEVLGIPEIGIDQNYYDLGGDSIRALQLISKINETLNVKLPFSIMQKVESVREMAAVLERYRNEEETITFIETHPGEESRLYLLPPLVGSAVAYLPLAAHMPDIPMTLFDYRIFSSLEEAVMQYAEKILMLCGGRDIILGGHSAGGNLAYLTAQYLEDRGVTIRGLVLLDSFYLKNMEQYDPEKLKRNFRILIKRVIMGNIDFEVDPESMNNYMDILLDGNPEGQMNADIYFIRSEPPYLKFGKVESVPEEWVHHTGGRFLIQDGKGFHPQMLAEPYIETTAGLIRKDLEEIFEKQKISAGS